MPTNWRIYGANTVATKLDRGDLPGFFCKTVVVGPNEAAIVVRDGQVREILTEAKVEAADVLDQLASVFRLGADISVFFVDTGPIDLTIFLGETEKRATYTNEARQVEASASQVQLRTVDILSASGQIGWTTETEHYEQGSGSATARSDVSTLALVAMTADKEIVQAECRVRLRIDPDGVIDFIGLLKGKRGLATWDLSALLRDELFAKLLVPEIATRKAEDLRGDKAFLSQLEGQVNSQLGQALSVSGLILDSFSILWGLTEQERADIARRRAEREEQARDFARTRRVAHLMREQEIAKTRIANLQELKTASASGDQEYQDLLLASEIDRQLMVKGKQVDDARIDAQIREIELETDNKESMAKLERRRAEEELRLDVEDREFRQKNAARLMAIEVEDKEMWSMVKMQIEMATSKHEQEMSKRRQESDVELRRLHDEIEDRYQQRKLKLDESLARMGMMERLVKDGLDTGVTDTSVLKEMLQQATEQEYATTSDAKVQARADAHAAANNVDTFKEAEDREREHQAKMTDLSSQMMQSAKQAPPQTVVTGTPEAVPPQPQAPIIINNSPSQVQPASTEQSCNSCGNSVQPDWKVCPSCGRSL